ncbi:hypothetical protein I302_104790 [Kwoniella bestiolae CBS 10118]|uniref:Uncharacterized protein n=1 Tax=Kwoniella bestiolae CBS 10118 TaxID=1296100 RepID=A0A1B9FRT6_9TREE|nr:hypothetical protein I302_09141 [Kwoniella bestiolae CBS 10118]OCF21462.1 hypothetical protein I302_09141 [Kwoniella bestiolae CBS 10118]
MAQSDSDHKTIEQLREELLGGYRYYVRSRMGTSSTGTPGALSHELEASDASSTILGEPEAEVPFRSPLLKMDSQSSRHGQDSSLDWDQFRLQLQLYLGMNEDYNNCLEYSTDITQPVYSEALKKTSASRNARKATVQSLMRDCDEIIQDEGKDFLRTLEATTIYLAESLSLVKVDGLKNPPLSNSTAQAYVQLSDLPDKAQLDSFQSEGPRALRSLLHEHLTNMDDSLSLAQQADGWIELRYRKDQVQALMNLTKSYRKANRLRFAVPTLWNDKGENRVRSDIKKLRSRMRGSKGSSEGRDSKTWAFVTGCESEGSKHSSECT